MFDPYRISPFHVACHKTFRELVNKNVCGGKIRKREYKMERGQKKITRNQEGGREEEDIVFFLLFLPFLLSLPHFRSHTHTLTHSHTHTPTHPPTPSHTHSPKFPHRLIHSLPPLLVSVSQPAHNSTYTLFSHTHMVV